MTIGGGAMRGAAVASALVAAWATASVAGQGGDSAARPPAARDWRAFENGEIEVRAGGPTLPEGSDYVEGMAEFALSDRLHLRATTVARQHEGHPSQHIIGQRSDDGGRTWGAWFDVEPEGPPLASYGSFLRHPATGRVFFIYHYGTPPGVRVPGAPHHVGHVAFRTVDAEGRFSERRFLDLPLTAIDRTNVFKGKVQAFYNAPRPTLVVGEDGYGWYTKLGPRPLVETGEAFIVRFVGWARSDALESLPIELRPRGERGLRDPSGCIAEFGPIAVEGAHGYFKYRSRGGYAGLAESRDGGETWRTGPLTYEAGGRPVKNPEGPLTTRQDPLGRRFLLFYNNSHRLRGSRDLVYISHLRIDPDGLRVSEPELLLYRQDRRGREEGDRERLNPPALRFSGETVVGVSADKLERRRFEAPLAFFDRLASQWTDRTVPANGLILDEPRPGREVRGPALPDAREGGCFSIAFSVRLAESRSGQVILAGPGEAPGIRVTTGDKDDLALAMADGRGVVRLTSDAAALAPGRGRHVAILVDGLAGLVSLVIDGRFQDGGAGKERGTERFGPDFGVAIAAGPWQVGPDLKGSVRDLRVFGRALLTSDAVALHRASAPAAEAGSASRP